VGAYPHRFRTHEQSIAAQWPDCRCGHPAKLHGLLVQHVGGSGCFKTFWKNNEYGSRVFSSACKCEEYRPVTPRTGEQIAAAPIHALPTPERTDR
jgi:hypothetical protein